jgi:hypothetical protein
MAMPSNTIAKTGQFRHAHPREKKEKKEQKERKL